MRYQLSAPALLGASLVLPSSKSISNRALILNQLSDGAYRPMNLSECDDTKVLIRGLETPDRLVDIGAAGTAMRFLTAYYAITPGCRILTGTERMCQRPIRILVDALCKLGAEVEYAGTVGFPPLCIKGKQLEGGWLQVDGSMSSQFISALLMIGPRLTNGLRLKIEGKVVSRPYINLTLRLMRHYGAIADWDGTDCIAVNPGEYHSIPISVESDWSAASYWYEMVALAPEAEVELIGLENLSLQGDSRVKDLFALLGVETIFTDSGVVLRKRRIAVDRMEFNLVEQPDLAQTVVVACALLDVPFRFSGLQNLIHKETNRIEALVREMRKLGCVLREEVDGVLSWDGNRHEPDRMPIIDTYDDHRMAMAFAPACFRFEKLVIDNPQVVSKSYPGFWADLSKAGFRVHDLEVSAR